MNEEKQRSWWFWPVVLAVAAPVLAFTLGLDVAHSLLTGLTIVAITLAARALVLGDRAVWPRLPWARRDGARRDVSSLSWTLFGQRGELSSAGRERLRAACVGALEVAGVDVTTPAGRRAAEELLGTAMLDHLLDPTGAAPDVRALHAALTALETLDLRKGHA